MLSDHHIAQLDGADLLGRLPFETCDEYANPDMTSSSLFNDYNAQITVMRLYTSWLPGSRLEFPLAGGGAPTTAVYFRINTLVKGPGGTRAETSALYRYVL